MGLERPKQLEPVVAAIEIVIGPARFAVRIATRVLAQKTDATNLCEERTDFAEFHVPYGGNRLDVLEGPPRRSLDDLFRPVDSHRRIHGDQNVFRIDGSPFVPSGVDDLSPDFIRRPQNFTLNARAGKQGHTCRTVMVTALIDCQLAGRAPGTRPDKLIDYRLTRQPEFELVLELRPGWFDRLAPRYDTLGFDLPLEDLVTARHVQRIEFRSAENNVREPTALRLGDNELDSARLIADLHAHARRDV